VLGLRSLRKAGGPLRGFSYARHAPRLRAASSGLIFRGLFGQLSEGDPQGPRLLWVPETFNGRVQRVIKDASLAGEKVAYLANLDRGGSLIASALYDDELIAEVGMPARSTGSLWESVDAVYAVSNFSGAIRIAFR
jgi:hypothetical protein